MNICTMCEGRRLFVVNDTTWPFIARDELTGRLGIGFGKCKGQPHCSPNCGKGQFHGWASFRQVFRVNLLYMGKLIHQYIWAMRGCILKLKEVFAL